MSSEGLAVDVYGDACMHTFISPPSQTCAFQSSISIATETSESGRAFPILRIVTSRPCTTSRQAPSQLQRDQLRDITHTPAMESDLDDLQHQLGLEFDSKGRPKKGALPRPPLDLFRRLWARYPSGHTEPDLLTAVLSRTELTFQLTKLIDLSLCDRHAFRALQPLLQDSNPWHASLLQLYALFGSSGLQWRFIVALDKLSHSGMSLAKALPQLRAAQQDRKVNGAGRGNNRDTEWLAVDVNKVLETNGRGHLPAANADADAGAEEMGNEDHKALDAEDREKGETGRDDDNDNGGNNQNDGNEESEEWSVEQLRGAHEGDIQNELSSLRWSSGASVDSSSDAGADLDDYAALIAPGTSNWTPDPIVGWIDGDLRDSHDLSTAFQLLPPASPGNTEASQASPTVNPSTARNTASDKRSINDSGLPDDANDSPTKAARKRQHHDGAVELLKRQDRLHSPPQSTLGVLSQGSPSAQMAMNSPAEAAAAPSPPSPNHQGILIPSHLPAPQTSGASAPASQQPTPAPRYYATTNGATPASACRDMTSRLETLSTLLQEVDNERIDALLNPESRVTANIIDYILLLLVPNDIHVVESSNVDERQTSSQTYRPSLTMNLQAMPRMILPVPFCEHWAVAVLDPATHSAEILDSIPGHASDLLKRRIQAFYARLPNRKNTTLQFIYNPDVPRQQDNVNCGIHTIFNALSRSTGNTLTNIHVDTARYLLGVLLRTAHGKAHNLEPPVTTGCPTPEDSALFSEQPQTAVNLSQAVKTAQVALERREEKLRQYIEASNTIDSTCDRIRLALGSIEKMLHEQETIVEMVELSKKLRPEAKEMAIRALGGLPAGHDGDRYNGDSLQKERDGIKDVTEIVSAVVEAAAGLRDKIRTERAVAWDELAKAASCR